LWCGFILESVAVLPEGRKVNPHPGGVGVVHPDGDKVDRAFLVLVACVVLESNRAISAP